MKNINWRVRFKNPVFVAQFILSIFTPILAFVGLSFSDITTWATLGDLIVQAYSNPYLLGLVVISVWNSINDPTVEKFGDSDLALKYQTPKKNK